MSRWRAIEWAEGADLAPAPALLAGASDRALVGRARATWVLRRGFRLPWTRGGSRLWAMLVDLEARGLAAARPVWLVETAFAWMVLARVPSSAQDVAVALGVGAREREGAVPDHAPSAAGPPGHRERRRLLASVRALATGADRAGWPGLVLAADDVLVAGWPGSHSPLLVGPRAPRARAGRASAVARPDGWCLTRTDRARLNPRAGRGTVPLQEPRA